MEELFQRTWYGRYWLKLMMNDHLLLTVIAVVIFLVYLFTRIAKRD